MALKEYNVEAGGRRGSFPTTMRLSDEDAKRMGLTSKDLVKKSRGSEPLDDEFKPQTEADLDPHAAEVARAAAEAAQREAERVNAEQAERVRVADEAAKEAEARAKAAKQAEKTPNKQAAPAKNKAVATPTTKQGE
jgi:membrane protein involved in colicin uptake